MEYAVLVDPAKCCGCRGCLVACKRCNNLSGEETIISGEWTNSPKLSYNTYNQIKFMHIDTHEWHFFNWRCMHCEVPACAEACPVEAITKYEEGPVVIDQDRCIGCKFCVSACPFDIPKFDSVSGKVSKCSMCFDRVSSGKEPACAQSCSTDALLFGTRDEIIQKAKVRKEELNGYIYGDVDNKPLGGSGFIYVLDAESSVYGLPNVGENLSPTVPVLNLSKWLLVPAALGGLFYLIAWRKRRMEEKEE